jgi:glycosyltransferase involved in cell wall biosynthesis
MTYTSILIDGIIFQNQMKGGVSRIYQEILPRICDLDNSISIELFTTGSTLQSLPSHPNIHEFSFPNIRKFFRPKRIFHTISQEIINYLIHKRYINYKKSIWHSSYYTNLTDWKGPTIVTVHDMIYERYPDLFSKQYDNKFRVQKRKCILQADTIICDSESTQMDVEMFLGVESHKCTVIHLASSQIFKVLEQVNKHLPDTPFEPFILFIGNRYHYKNFELLVQAFSNWKYRNQVIMIVVSNEPWTNTEIDLFRTRSIINRIFLISNPDDYELCRLYNKASALIFPSLYEGFGIPLIEAMKCGCPIVASNIPSTIEIARNAPIYFDPLDMEQLIDALNQALEDGRLSDKVNIGHQVAKEYTWDITAQKTLEVYQKYL